MMPCLVATAPAFPAHYVSQTRLSAELRKVWERQGLDLPIFDRIQKSVSVEGRYLALPLERYLDLMGFADSNRVWAEVALELGERALRTLLERAELAPEDLSLLATTTVTGIAVPSLEARLMNRMPFRRDLKRMPLFGLGCLAGTAGVARVADCLRRHPDEAAVLLSVELCSLTLQLGDLSMANVISTGLFGDGAAAVLLVGDRHPLAQRPGHPQVVGSRSVFFPDSEDVMGWEPNDFGLKIVLGPGVPGYAARLRPDVDAFLGDHGLTREDITHWITHPGGPKVIDALESGFSLAPGTLDHVRKNLRRYGNLSSTSVLLILDELLQQPPPASGTHGLMLSMGPGFSAEAVLLRW